MKKAIIPILVILLLSTVVYAEWTLDTNRYDNIDPQPAGGSTYRIRPSDASKGGTFGYIEDGNKATSFGPGSDFIIDPLEGEFIRGEIVNFTGQTTISGQPIDASMRVDVSKGTLDKQTTITAKEDGTISIGGKEYKCSKGTSFKIDSDGKITEIKIEYEGTSPGEFEYQGKKLSFHPGSKFILNGDGEFIEGDIKGLIGEIKLGNRPFNFVRGLEISKKKDGEATLTCNTNAKLEINPEGSDKEEFSCNSGATLEFDKKGNLKEIQIKTPGASSFTYLKGTSIQIAMEYGPGSELTLDKDGKFLHGHIKNMKGILILSGTNQEIRAVTANITVSRAQAFVSGEKEQTEITTETDGQIKIRDLSKDPPGELTLELQKGARILFDSEGKIKKFQGKLGNFPTDTPAENRKVIFGDVVLEGAIDGSEINYDRDGKTTLKVPKPTTGEYKVSAGEITLTGKGAADLEVSAEGKIKLSRETRGASDLIDLDIADLGIHLKDISYGFEKEVVITKEGLTATELDFKTPDLVRFKQNTALSDTVEFTSEGNLLFPTTKDLQITYNKIVEGKTVTTIFEPKGTKLNYKLDGNVEPGAQELAISPSEDKMVISARGSVFYQNEEGQLKKVHTIAKDSLWVVEDGKFTPKKTDYEISMSVGGRAVTSSDAGVTASRTAPATEKALDTSEKITPPEPDKEIIIPLTEEDLTKEGLEALSSLGTLTIKSGSKSLAIDKTRTPEEFAAVCERCSGVSSVVNQIIDRLPADQQAAVREAVGKASPAAVTPAPQVLGPTINLGGFSLDVDSPSKYSSSDVVAMEARLKSRLEAQMQTITSASSYEIKTLDWKEQGSTVTATVTFRGSDGKDIETKTFEIIVNQ